MRFMHNSHDRHAFRELRQVDLNLLITFAAIAEEKSVTAAASRLLLSQPAVSRALQRARAMFQDDLLLRSPQGFELTMRGRKILQELEDYYQDGESRYAEPVRSDAREKPLPHFRPDNVCTVVLPRCAGSMQTDATKCSLNSFPGRAASRN